MPAAAACHKWRIQAAAGTQCCCAAVCCARWPHLQPQEQLQVLHPRQQAQQRVHLCQADSPTLACCNDNVTTVGRACGAASLRCLWRHQVKLGAAARLWAVAQGGPRCSRARRRPADERGSAGGALPPGQDRQRRRLARACAAGSGAHWQCSRRQGKYPMDHPRHACTRQPSGGAQRSPFGPKKPKRSRRRTPRHSSSIAACQRQVAIV